MIRLFTVILVCLFSLSTAAAQDTPAAWSLVSVQPLGDVLGEDYSPFLQPFLAPDGSAIAWSVPNEGFFVYTFDDQRVTASPWPEDYRGYGRYSSPAWSPDGAYLAFTESVFDYFYESDLWLLDSASGEITNRTDDGVSGGILSVDQSFGLDYLPTWNPVNGDLYFFRTVQPEDGVYTTELHLMPVSRSEPKLVSDLTHIVPIYSIYRPAAISPDGTRMALIVLGQQLDNPRNGVWVLDLRTRSPQQVTGVAEFRAGLPDWQEEPTLFPETVSWAGNDALVVGARDIRSATGVAQMAYYVDLLAQTVTPITTFSDVAEPEDLLADDGAESPVYRIPRAGVVSPDGGTFFFLRHGIEGDRAGISAVSLPPDGSPPVDLGEIEDFELTPAASALPAVSVDGKALMYGYLFQFEPS